MTTVLIALDEPLAGLGLATVIGSTPDLNCCDVLTVESRVRDAVVKHRPDVLVLDVRRRLRDASLVPEVLALSPTTRILIAVDHGPEECALRHLLAQGERTHLSKEALGRLDDCCLTSLRQQATGCIEAGSQPDMVIEAVRAVAEGKLAAAPWLSAWTRAVRGSAGTPADAAPPITERELEAVALLAEGLTNREIAERLEITEQTVKNHLARAVRKLGAETRLEVGLLASRHHLRLSSD